VDTYRNHLAAWVEMERHGFDGIAINEHHSTPFGLNNSPNLIAAAISQLTTKMKILIYANLLPLHDPLRLAEELAMLDCLSNGRLIAGVARGAPREYKILNVPMSESRGRFEEPKSCGGHGWTRVFI
jgi:alkanesulfonate monooxygenase SsuD/methylene tetrahydromethanopterin reductase-like flavin-dependent oxidoreductase (luciferase family)